MTSPARVRLRAATAAALVVALGAAAPATPGASAGAAGGGAPSAPVALDGRLAGLAPAPRDPGGRFRNRPPLPERAGFSVSLPFFARRVFGLGRSLEGLPSRAEAAAAALARVSTEAEASVTWIGHATVLVRQDGVRWLADPQWSARAGPGGRLGAERFTEPGLALEALPPLDFVLVSHNHYDHLDLPTLRELAARHPRATFYVPLENGELLRDEGVPRVVELDWGEFRDHGPVRVHCLPARHWSRRGLFDTDRSLWSSWAVTGSQRRVYFGGDTGLFDELSLIGSLLGPFDLAALPIGAYEPKAMMQPVHLNPEEAVAAADRLGARRTLGVHFGTFDLTDEPVGEPPLRFRAAAEAAGWERGRAWVFALGETRPF